MAKPGDHKYLMEWVGAYKHLSSITFEDEKGRKHTYEWMNDVPLHGGQDSIHVNFLRCTVIGTDKKGNEKITYKNSWVTDIVVLNENIRALVSAGRCRWKVENEMFNVMKNDGYCMERNYGHGKDNLCFNFYIPTLLAFFMRQIFELTDGLYRQCRVKFGSKRDMWETLRAYIKILVFESWEALLQFALNPKRYVLAEAAAP